MTPKQRLMKTIKHEKTDRVPVSPRIHAFLHKYYGCSCWLHHLQAAEEFGFDPIICILPLIPNYVTSPFGNYEELKGVSINLKLKRNPNFTDIKRIIQTPKGDLSDKIRMFRGGIEYGILPDPLRIERLVKEPRDLEKLQYLLSDLSKTNVSDIPRIKREVGERGLVEISVSSPLDAKAGDAYGLDNMMVSYYDNKNFLIDLLRLFQEYTLAETEVYLRAGADVIFGSWYYASLSAGWSPEIYKEIFLSLIKEHVDLVHSYGAFYHFYDDGKCMPIIEMLKETGIDVLSTLTPPPVGDVDLKKVKKRIGEDVCLKGNVDIVHTIWRGDPKRIEEAVKKVISQAAEGGGFILSTSDSIRNETPLENVKTFFEAAHRYGRY